MGHTPGRRWARRSEAAIGALFVAALVVGLLFNATSSHLSDRFAYYGPTTTTCPPVRACPTTTTTTAPPTTTATTPAPTTTPTTRPGATTSTTRRTVPVTATTTPVSPTTVPATTPATTAPTATTTATTPGTTTPTSTTTTPTTTPPTTTAPTTVPANPQQLQLAQPSVEPGEGVVASGQGCAPGSQVTLLIAGTTVGTTTADAGGHFSATLHPGQLAVGPYTVVARCGGTTTQAPLNVVLVSQVNQATSSLVILIFFVLIALVGLRRQFVRR